MLDAIVIGGGFAGVTAARELTIAGLDCTLIEARDRLGGRTWRRDWNGDMIELGGGWVHWHQPYAWAELERAGQGIGESAAPELIAWAVGGERRTGTYAQRHAIARRAWNRFVEPTARVLPRPHDPHFAIAALAPFDAQTIEQRIDELGLDAEERDVLVAELEGVASGFIDDAGAVSVLRLHALAGGSLELAEDAGGRYTFGAGTDGLIGAIATQAPFAQWLSTPVDSLGPVSDGVEVRTRKGDVLRARTCVVTVPLNVLPHIEIEGLSPAKRDAIALGQASRGLKLWLRVKGESRGINSMAPAHPFGYLMVDRLLPDGSQLLVGFGRDASVFDIEDRTRDAAGPGRAASRARDRGRDLARLAGRRVHARHLGDPPAGLVRAAPRRHASSPRAGSSSPARIWRTAGVATSTARSNPACARRAR